MTRRFLRLGTALPVLACTAFVLALVDLSRGFELVSSPALVALSVSSFVLFVVSLGSRIAGSWVASVLLLATTISLGIRALGYEPVTRRSSEEWNRVLREEAEESAAKARAAFGDLARTAAEEARTLSADPKLRAALERSSPTSIADAFSMLASIAPLPQAHPAGTPGAALFDEDLRPVAWAGSNEAIEWLSSRTRMLVDTDVAVLDTGPKKSLVASSPLDRVAGFVSVEVPLAADRRLENRYLRDFDALSSLAGKTVETRFPSSTGEAEAMALSFETAGDPFWSMDGDAARIHFRLPHPDGSALGAGTIAIETVEAARLEHRRRLSLISAVVLALGAAAALLLVAAKSPASAWLLPAIWGLRLVLRIADVPMGLGVDLDNPAHYASSLLFGLARSPADLLVTALALLASCRILAGALDRPAERERDAFRLGGALAAPASLLLFILVEQAVEDAWVNSNLALSEVSFSAVDLPRLTVQLALLLMFASAAWLSYLALSRSSEGLARSLARDAVVVLLFWIVLREMGSQDLVLLSVAPLVLIELVVRGRKRARAFFARRRLHVRLPASLLFSAVGVVAFYPSLAYFESATVKSFIETTVAPVVLNHRRARTTTMIETARTIDRMFEEGILGDLGREDLAFRIWVSTDLAVSSLSSAVEVVDPQRRIVSRFALSFPAVSPETDVAPEAWIPQERSLPGDSSHPGFVTARRSFEGPDGARWEIRVRLAADWRNLPFIATADPYLHLFRSTAAETPRRFPHQELELIVFSPEGDMVFQSVGGSLSPGEDILRQVDESPVWWQHPHEGQRHRTYLVSDGDYVYTLSYPEKGALTESAELSMWVLLAMAWGGAVFTLGLILGALRFPFGIPPREIVHGIGGSFSAKLYIAFVLVALVPIVLLAFLIRGIVVRELERDVEREGVERAGLAARIVREVHFSQPTSAVGVAPLTDSVLERVRTLTGFDVDIHVGGELLATSKPELVASGLVATRAAPAAHRDIVVGRLSHSVHRESVGSFRYLVVSVPIVLPPWSEPGILSLPLASRQAEIDRKVASLNQAVLLAAILFSLLAAGLAYSLAHRIAGPINQLTEATRAVAEGSLDLSLEPASRDEIGTLFSAFNQMTADLKRRRGELERTKKLEAWAEMARQVAHEVKNPLTPIQLSTEHLLRVYGDDEVDFEKVLRDCSDTILQQVRALRQISMEFSTFASPGPLNLEPTDVEALLSETIEPYRKNPPAGVTLRFDVAPGGVPRTLADARLLKRTFVNLLENALHALNGKGAIDVRLSSRTRDGNARIEVVVSDDGVGIDPEVKARVFEPYFSTRAAGTGLGLAIARKVVEDHEGDISLESERGKGTTVTVRLPVVPPFDSDPRS
jgi:signal transduction histidine kinase